MPRTELTWAVRGAILAVTLQGADECDPTTMLQTIIETTQSLRDLSDDPQTHDKIAEDFMAEAVTDKEYHSKA